MLMSECTSSGPHSPSVRQKKAAPNKKGMLCSNVTSQISWGVDTCSFSPPPLAAPYPADEDLHVHQRRPPVAQYAGEPSSPRPPWPAPAPTRKTHLPHYSPYCAVVSPHPIFPLLPCHCFAPPMVFVLSVLHFIYPLVSQFNPQNISLVIARHLSVYMKIVCFKISIAWFFSEFLPFNNGGCADQAPYAKFYPNAFNASAFPRIRPM